MMAHFSLLAIEQPFRITLFSSLFLLLSDLALSPNLTAAPFFPRNRVIYTRLFVHITNYSAIDILRRILFL